MKKIVLTLALIATASTAYARDQISIVGSSTVYPFATTVAEKFGQIGNKTPVIESTGSGGGFKLFCGGVGPNTPDITNASRAIKDKEVKRCKENGVTPIERIIGYDGITISNALGAEHVNFTKVDILMATAEKVLINGEWVANPHKKWSDIRPELPDLTIDIMVPPPTSGTRDAFVELILEDACKELGINVKEYKAECHNLRSDGRYVVQMGENDNLIIEKLVAEPRRFGVFGFSFLDQNRDKVQATSIDGVKPEFETIADGSYKVSRPLFYYIKKEHIGIIPGLEEYDALFKKMQDEDGPLTEQGLIPLQN